MFKNTELLTKVAVTSSYRANVEQDTTGQDTGASLFSELANREFEPDRHNRLCITISDIHLTDGTVGIQNLLDDVWNNFFSKIIVTCNDNQIKEVVIVLDGDVIDLIRSGEWSENNFYPWQRGGNEGNGKAKFDEIVDKITKGIVAKHEHFFSLLKGFDAYAKENCATLEVTEIIVLLGNHDKELMLVNDSLVYFYEHALGRKLDSFTDAERAYIGRMYGDKDMFLRDKTLAPYFPFYHADKGFRFFTTHGQWRDSENSRAVKADGDKPGWSAGDGWQHEVWEKLNYSPFLDPCFGDTVAAGVLSTFIYKTKNDLGGKNIEIERLNRILDELDLYRPSYLAVQRILEEAKSMKRDGSNPDAVEIIQNNLSECISNWLSWDFTFESASKSFSIGLKIARVAIKAIKIFGRTIELTAILWGMKLMAYFSHYKQTGVELKKMRDFPGFMPPYSNNGFQIHGEGHTHNPLEAEANLDAEVGDAKNKFNTNFTYINFGTWRDQIIPRQKKGYRRKGVLRVFNILDLQADEEQSDKSKRRFIYYTQDYTIWRDSLDRIKEKETLKEKEAVF